MKNYLINTDNIKTLIDCFDSAANLKDAITKKYVYANQENLFRLGLNNINDLVGRTIVNLNYHLAWKWSYYIVEIEKLDQIVINSKQNVISDCYIWPDVHGILWRHHLHKIPLINSYNQVEQILTLSKKEQPLKPLALLDLYKRYYLSKSLILNYLRHIDLLKFFNLSNLPTEPELRVLLAMRFSSIQKEAANILDLNLKTVEAHLAKLRKKVLASVWLEQVIDAIKLQYC